MPHCCAVDRYTIVGLGELLWDLFPSGKQLGGAPSNFAYITHLLGDRAVVASRIGDDELGRTARTKLVELGLDVNFLQTDPGHATGTVRVEVDANGQPAFEITQPVAWDFLEWTPQWKSLAQRADAVCFGSLAQRGTASRATIKSFLEALGPEAARVFDVNLRQDFYSANIIREGLQHASLVKLNHHELPRVMELLQLDYQDEISGARSLLQKFGLILVCVTRGERGSLLISADDIHEQPAVEINVVDTVGSGDAFTAALVHHHLRGASLAMMNIAANRMGAWVAGRAGGTPVASPAEIMRMMQ